MGKFPKDASRLRVVAALAALGFQIVREREHIAMVRENADGTKTPVTLPNHKTIKSSTLRTICRQTAITRDDFLKAYDAS
jgi:predicted RNA binding protein YcfA (HicA-like mRNA interferase family)